MPKKKQKNTIDTWKATTDTNPVDKQLTDHFRKKKNSDKKEISVDSKGTMEDAPEESEETLRSGSSGLTTHGKETKISNIPPHVSFGIPETFTINHILNGSNSLRWNMDSGGSMNGNDDSMDFTIRLNTIYDLFPTWTGIQSPTWRTYMENLYQKYSVLECKVDLEFFALGLHVETSNTVLTDNSYVTANVDYTGNTSDWIILFRNYGNTVQPTFNIYPTALLNDPQMKAMPLKTVMKDGTKYKQVGHLNTSWTHDDYFKLVDIVQDTMDDTWTDKATDPTLSHTLRIMPRRKYDIASQATVTEHMLVYYRITVLCQWKQLVAAYAFTQA